MNKTVLAAAGVDCNAGIARCSGNIALYSRLLGRLTEYPFDKVRRLYTSGAAEELRALVREIYSSALNLSVIPLAAAAADLVRKLDCGKPVSSELDLFELEANRFLKAVAESGDL